MVWLLMTYFFVFLLSGLHVVLTGESFVGLCKETELAMVACLYAKIIFQKTVSSNFDKMFTSMSIHFVVY